MEILFEKWINIFKNLGLITSKTDSFKRKITGFLFRLFFIESLLFLQLMYLREVKDLLDFTRLLSLLSTYISYFVKAVNVLYHSKLIEDLVESMKNELKDYEFNEKFKIRISRAKKIFNSLLVAAFLVTFLGGFEPFFSHELALKMWFPYDLKNPILFWISALYQYISTVGGSWADAALELTPVFFMAYITGMLEQLCDDLENLEKPKKLLKKKEAWLEVKETAASFDEKLLIIIQKHKNLIEIMRKFEKIFNFTFFVRGLTSAVVFCTTAFTLVSVDDTRVMLRLFFYMIATSGQLSIPSYFGNEISFISDKLSTALFHSEWYDEEDKGNFLMLMIFLRRKIQVTTFKIFQLDLGTFLRVCNSAYSLYAVFKNIYNSR